MTALGCRRFPGVDRGDWAARTSSLGDDRSLDRDGILWARPGQSSWQVTGTRFGGEQGESPRMFLGGLGWPADEQHVAVPRPGAGDVLVLSPDDLSTAARVDVGRQPLEAAALRSGIVVARDWHTGDLLLAG
jgi:hypothetical protein